MRELTENEQAVLSVVMAQFGDVATLHVGKQAANVRQGNMDAVNDLADFFRDHGIHDYSAQRIGPEYKVLSECMIFDGVRLDLSAFSFNRPKSRSRCRFWIPALKRMTEKDDVLAFAEDKGLPIVINLSGVARADPEMAELRRHIANSGATAASLASAIPEAREAIPSEAYFSTSPAEQDEMERYSRILAQAYLESLEWKVTPTSGSVPYDLIAVRDGVTMYVEVKSSKGPADQVILTNREVENAVKQPSQHCSSYPT